MEVIIQQEGMVVQAVEQEMVHQQGMVIHLQYHHLKETMEVLNLLIHQEEAEVRLLLVVMEVQVVLQVQVVQEHQVQ